MDTVTISREDALLFYAVALRERSALMNEMKSISNDTISRVIGKHIGQLSDLLSRMEEVLHTDEQTMVS